LAFAKNIHFVMLTKHRLSCGNAPRVELHPIGGLRVTESAGEGLGRFRPVRRGSPSASPVELLQ